MKLLRVGVSESEAEMPESVQMAIVGLIGTAFGILMTKGIDAIIRFRRSEGQMADESENKLLARIVHLESEVARLQNEISELQYQRGRSDSIIDLLQGRVDKAKMPQIDDE